MISEPVSSEAIRAVMDILAATYHGSGAVELGDPYKVLVATVISQRTREEQTAPVSERVFSRYPDFTKLASAAETDLYALLQGSEYREAKAPRLIVMAQMIVERFDGQVPNDLDALLTLPGVGRKTANCVLIYAFSKAALCVDIHCHRITNRLGWVSTKTPDQTEKHWKKSYHRIYGQAATVSFCSMAGRFACPQRLFAAAVLCVNNALTAWMMRQRSGSAIPDAPELPPKLQGNNSRWRVRTWV